jgi:predicted enzyme related to lactoylglutathione lyase
MVVRRLLAALIAGVCASAAIAASPTLAPLSNSASPEHHVGKIVFVQLVTPDIAASKQFYAGLFGWTFHDVKEGERDYADAFLDGRLVAGLLQKKIPANAKRQPAWLSFVAVRDVDAAQKAAVGAGAKLLFGPRDFPNRGREAVLADPQGAVFALLASSSGDGADELASPGEWIWSSLLTSAPDEGAGFYQKIFGYEVFDSTDDDDRQHLMLATDGYARASANMLPAKRPGMQPHWLNYVRVDDAAAMSAKAVTLGGRVLVEPRVDRHGGMLAIVADPNGAAFGLLEWNASQTKEVAP